VARKVMGTINPVKGESDKGEEISLGADKG
jgi:hypothetical protein